jgi:ubiquinone/menaquinone biosynthesis C-methylase UbiE
MKRELAEKLLKKTIQDYNLISGDFSSSRRFLWPELKFLENYISEKDKVLDLGCGSGRLFELFKGKNIGYTGADASEELLKEAKKKYPDAKFVETDAMSLPFPDNYFDKIFSIALFHHIPSREMRISFLKEARRVLKPKGLIILTCWHLWKNKKGLKLILKFFLLKLFRLSEMDFGDILFPWQNKVDRYLHCFKKRELKKLLKEAGFEIKEQRVLKRGKNSNLYIMGRK